MLALLRFDAWRYRIGMALSTVAVIVGIPVGFIICCMLALGLL